MKTTIKFFLLVILLSFVQIPTSNATVHIPVSKENVITDSSEKKLNKKEKRVKDKERRKLKRRMWLLGIGLGICIFGFFYSGVGVMLFLLGSLFGGAQEPLLATLVISGFLVSLALSIFLIFLISRTRKKLKSKSEKEQEEETVGKTAEEIEKELAKKKKQKKRAGIILAIVGVLLIGLGFAL